MPAEASDCLLGLMEKGQGPSPDEIQLLTEAVATIVSLLMFAVMFPNIASSIQHVRAGKLRALAVTSVKRSAIAPEIPTLAESGVPGYELSSWFGLLAPAGTPPAVLRKLQQEIARIYELPDIRDKLMAQGVEPLASDPEEFSAQIAAEIARWAKLFKAADLKAE